MVKYIYNKRSAKDIPGTEGRYRATPYGQIYTVLSKKDKPLKRARILKQKPDARSGKNTVRLLIDGKMSTRRVGMLVATTLLKNPKSTIWKRTMMICRGK